jgi:alkyl sulfatase BDS1-like metallo-beta-lactamase superfamily hydrolase
MARQASNWLRVVGWTFTDTDESWVVTVENCTLTYLSAARAEAADASVTLARGVLDRIIARRTTVEEAVVGGDFLVSGDGRKLGQLMELWDEFPRMFDIAGPKRT